MMKTDPQLQRDVIDGLAFDPTVDATSIGVTAKRGVIELTGFVRSFSQKYAAEYATKGVRGVHAIAEELKVEVASIDHRSDAEIARAARLALESDIEVPSDKVTPIVENGWLTLEGRVDFVSERDAAKRAVGHLIGVEGVTNLVACKAAVEPGSVTTKIRKAFERNAAIDADKVQIYVARDIVTLRGDVGSWNEHDKATYAASSVPGVRLVHNYTIVG